MIDTLKNAKLIASQKALTFIKNHITIGLGTGSTVTVFLELLSRYIKDKNLSISTIASSLDTRQKAQELNIPLLPPKVTQKVDLYIDGTDEFDKNMYMIKGGGGALLCEKIIAQAADQVVIITDETKFSEQFGSFPLPIEIVPFEIGITLAKLRNIQSQFTVGNDLKMQLRQTSNGTYFKTDMGNMIVDISFNKIVNPHQLAQDIIQISGVVEHGLFLKEANHIITEKREIHQ